MRYKIINTVHFQIQRINLVKKNYIQMKYEPLKNICYLTDSINDDNNNYYKTLVIYLCPLSLIKVINPFPTELGTNFKLLFFSKKDRKETEQRNTKIKSH